MASLIPSAKATLSYPLYACGFDPLDATRLVVGGGGGAGRSGVGNKLTVFQTTKPSELEETAELDLGKDEDSVMSLAVGPHKGSTTLVYAGVNSAPEEVQKGRNEHLRVLGIETSTKGKGAKSTSSCRISELSRTALFSAGEQDVYQRVVRLSRPFAKYAQFGVVATGLAKKAEVVVFDASSKTPSPKGAVQVNVEAADVDVLQTGKDTYLLIYCTQHEIYLKTIEPKTDTEEPACIYTIPGSDQSPKPNVPSFRALRWLSKDFLLVLSNLSSSSGVCLQILRLPTTAGESCRISQSHRLSSHITKATALSVTNLSSPTSPTSEQGNTQFVLAVAGHDSSIALFKIGLQNTGSIFLPSKIKPFKSLKCVHPLQITSLAFSSFIPPEMPITASTPQQVLRLASTGMGNSLVVHTIPLFPMPWEVGKGKSERPRYVVALPSTKVATGAGVLMSMLIVILLAFIIQAGMELRGGKNLVNAREFIPSTIQRLLKPQAAPAIQHTPDLSTPAIARRRSIIPQEGNRLLRNLGGMEGQTLFLQDTASHETNPELVEETKKGVKAELYEEEKHEGKGKKWEELSEKERLGWMGKLREAGHWVEEMGETVFKGVVFGELGGLVGQIAGGG